jgi:DNA-directed RNA polymerase subunit RPC12/RpoP
MRASELQLFVCTECGTGMERVHGVPVLQSLKGHGVHRCGACGHILLVQQERASEWSADWLGPLFMELQPAITCVALV